MNAKQKEQTIEEIKKLLEENNGIVKAEKLYPLGLTYKSIQGLVKAGILDHVKSGYYSMGYEEKPQEEIILGLFPDGILCMDSALYYYGCETILYRAGSHGAWRNGHSFCRWRDEDL